MKHCDNYHERTMLSIFLILLNKPLIVNTLAGTNLSWHSVGIKHRISWLELPVFYYWTTYDYQTTGSLYNPLSVAAGCMTEAFTVQ